MGTYFLGWLSGWRWRRNWLAYFALNANWMETRSDRFIFGSRWGGVYMWKGSAGSEVLVMNDHYILNDFPHTESQKSWDELQKLRAHTHTHTHLHEGRCKGHLHLYIFTPFPPLPPTARSPTVYECADVQRLPKFLESWSQTHHNISYDDLQGKR